MSEIYNEGVRVEREGPRKFAIYLDGQRWGHFLLRRDADTFATDLRDGRVFFSDAGPRLIETSR